MKALIGAALLLALGTVAGAKPAPIENPSPTLARIDASINIGLAQTMRERDYFQAPPPAFNAGGLPCRLQPVVFGKKRLAQFCQ